MRKALILVVVIFYFAGVGWLVGDGGEFCGAWVATVWNLNFPSAPGMPAGRMREEIARIVEVARRCGIGDLFVQVRAESCALYPSRLEPWSRFLTGRQGVSPGLDPLGEFLQEGERRGVRIHAWINPYRAAVNARDERARNHITNRLRRHTKRIGNLLWMDPGAEEVRRHIVEVVKEIVGRYPNLAGVHLDDYFYPYPPRGGRMEFPDEDTYGAYVARGGKLGREEWRRRNVNLLIWELHGVIKQRNPGMKFGVSPFGIYTKGEPPEVKAGVDGLRELCADPVLWMKEGWVDYIAPQLYWRDGGEQSFSALLRWWRSARANPRGIPIYAGIALERMEPPHSWPLSEIALQMKLEKEIGPKPHGGGVIFYNMGHILKDTKGIRGYLEQLKARGG
ncbi:MAG: family 10 glycosylhydrolase [Chthoniobacterales bacterium]|nr:family 10 glycosylhydrolase [Chthoniobacterales bacterium]